MKSELPNYCFFREDDSLISYHMPNFTSCHCVHETNTSKRKMNLFLLIALPIICFIFLVFVPILYFLRRMFKIKFEEMSIKNVDFVSFWDYDGIIAFKDIIEATEDFRTKYCIGAGAYGNVCKVQCRVAKLLH